LIEEYGKHGINRKPEYKMKLCVEVFMSLQGGEQCWNIAGGVNKRLNWEVCYYPSEIIWEVLK
jgi:hypothetical protein